MDIIESNVSINTSSFENEYFESLFNDFQYFFSNMMHNEPQFKIMLCGKSEGRDYCYITLPNQDEMLKVFEGNTVAGGTIESIDRKKTALVFIKNGETFKIVKNN